MQWSFHFPFETHSPLTIYTQPNLVGHFFQQHKEEKKLNKTKKNILHIQKYIFLVNQVRKMNTFKNTEKIDAERDGGERTKDKKKM